MHLCRDITALAKGREGKGEVSGRERAGEREGESERERPRRGNFAGIIAGC